MELVAVTSGGMQMILLEDTRQQDQKHMIKHKWFAENGIEIRRSKLYCGDYTLPTDQSVCIDTKKDIQELIGDICGKQHERFRSELIRAQEAGIQLIILVENRGWVMKSGNKNIVCPTILDLSELHLWINKRLFLWRNGKQLYPSATKGSTLMKACYTMETKYGCRFLFTTPEESGEMIVRLLNGQVD